MFLNLKTLENVWSHYHTSVELQKCHSSQQNYKNYHYMLQNYKTAIMAQMVMWKWDLNKRLSPKMLHNKTWN